MEFVEMTLRWRETAPRRKGLVELPVKKDNPWVARQSPVEPESGSYENWGPSVVRVSSLH